MHMLLGFDQSQPLPKLRLGDDFDSAFIDGRARGVVQIDGPAVQRQRQLLLAHDYNLHIRRRHIDSHTPMFANQLLRLAPRHPGQFAGNRNALARKRIVLPFIGDGHRGIGSHGRISCFVAALGASPGKGAIASCNLRDRRRPSLGFRAARCATPFRRLGSLTEPWPTVN